MDEDSEDIVISTTTVKNVQNTPSQNKTGNAANGNN